MPTDRAAPGYLHRRYVESLAEFGAPRLLPRSGGWLLERSVPGNPDRDAMGCYPLFACRDWSALAADIADLEREIVCVSLVADPFGGYEVADLRRAFKDVCVPFKEHFVIDPGRSRSSLPCAHHRRNVARAARVVEVARCTDPLVHAAEWIGLYANLVARHRISGIPAFSPAALTAQLAVPGLVMFRAVHRGQTVGIVLWYVHGDAASYHLGAYSADGYALRASYALFAYAIQDLSKHVAWLDLGAGAGVRGDAADGLTRFKRGWSTGTRPAYFCGAVCDPQRYRALAGRNGAAPVSYFPAYRHGEFG